MSATNEGWKELAIPDMLRRVLNIVRPGEVSKVDYKKARIRVKHGDLESNWIPWAAGRAGGNKIWSPPEVGEQVLMLAPGGDTSRAIALVGIFSDDNPANGDDGNLFRMTFKNGTVIEYDRDKNELNAKLKSGGKATIVADGGMTIDASGGLTIKGDITLTGGITMTGDVLMNGNLLAQGHVTSLGVGAPVTLSTHLHTGVVPGPGDTLLPKPGT